MALVLIAVFGWTSRNREQPLSIGFAGYGWYRNNGYCALFRITNNSRFYYVGNSTTIPVVTGGVLDGWPWTLRPNAVETIWIPMHRKDLP
jgi:hypothetical protein